ncbi:MAG: MoaD/ThiS family protein [Bacteroidota bacterium]
MTIQLLAFGIAKDILPNAQMEIEIAESTTIGDLKAHLFEQYPAFQQLRSLSFAVGTDYEKDGRILKDMEEVVIIPPVSGG